MRLEPAGFGDDFVDKMNRWKTQEHAKGRSVRRKMNGHYVKASLLSPTTWRDGVLRRFAAFCGVLRRFAAFCGVLRRFAAFCGVLRRLAAFYGVLRRFAARWQ